MRKSSRKLNKWQRFGKSRKNKLQNASGRYNRKRGHSWEGRFSEVEDIWFQVVKSHDDELDP